jgi:hypothetical protein
MVVRPVVAAIAVAVLAFALGTTIPGEAQPGQAVYVPRQ